MRETMPKNPPQDKKTIGKLVRGPVQTVSGIMKQQGWMQSLKQIRTQQQEWLEWFRASLPDELGGAIVNVVRKGEELTLLATSAAWSTRLRFALDPIMEMLKERSPDIVKVRVRVIPQSAGPEKK